MRGCYMQITLASYVLYFIVALECVVAAYITRIHRCAGAAQDLCVCNNVHTDLIRISNLVMDGRF